MKLMKKSLATILALAMCLTLLPVNVFAAVAEDMWGEPAPICGLEEHIHGDGCYAEADAVPYCKVAEQHDCSVDDVYDEETGELLSCALAEHVCGDGCYVYCGKEEHIHDEFCPEECFIEVHAHDWACFQAAPVLVCDLAEHVHMADCYPAAPVVDEEPEADDMTDLDPMENAYEEPETDAYQTAAEPAELEDDTKYIITDGSVDVSALNNWLNAAEGTELTIEVSSDVTGDVTFDGTLVIPKGKNVNFYGNGHTIRRSANNIPLIQLEGNLSLMDVTMAGSSDAGEALILVDGGTLTMVSATLKDNQIQDPSKNGGAVIVKGGLFVMHGTAIENCSAGGLGGAVAVEGGEFAMHNGTISSCGSGERNCAVYVAAGAKYANNGGSIQSDGDTGVVRALAYTVKYYKDGKLVETAPETVYTEGGGTVEVSLSEIVPEKRDDAQLCDIKIGNDYHQISETASVSDGTVIEVYYTTSDPSDPFRNEAPFDGKAVSVVLNLNIGVGGNKTGVIGEPTKVPDDKLGNYFWTEGDNTLNTLPASDWHRYVSFLLEGGNTASIIDPDIWNHRDPSISETRDEKGNVSSVVTGIYDPTGASTKSYIREGVIKWDAILTNNWTFIAEKLGLAEGTPSTGYEIIPYVVKYQTDDHTWHIDCAVLPSTRTQLNYVPNLLKGLAVSSDDFDCPTGELAYNGSISATVASLKYGGNTVAVDTAIPTTDNGKDVNLIFKGWSTSLNGPVEYKPGEPITVREGDATILYGVWLEEGKTHEISYTVEYYMDGELVENYTETVKQTVASDVTTLTVETVADKMPEGYVLDTEKSDTLPATVSNGDVIKVYYKAQEPDEYELSFTKSVQMQDENGNYVNLPGDKTVKAGTTLLYTIEIKNTGNVPVSRDTVGVMADGGTRNYQLEFDDDFFAEKDAAVAYVNKDDPSDPNTNRVEPGRMGNSGIWGNGLTTDKGFVERREKGYLEGLRLWLNPEETATNFDPDKDVVLNPGDTVTITYTYVTATDDIPNVEWWSTGKLTNQASAPAGWGDNTSDKVEVIVKGPENTINVKVVNGTAVAVGMNDNGERDTELGWIARTEGNKITNSDMSSAEITVPWNYRETITFTANEGYALDTVTVDGVPAKLNEDGSYNFTKVQANHSIEVVYAEDTIGIDNPDEGDGIPDKYQATVTYTAENGKVSLEKAVVTLYDESGKWAENGTGYLTAEQIATATADTANGYNQATESWDNGGKPTTKTAITEDVTYTVTFTKNEYTITVKYVDDSKTPVELKGTYTDKVGHGENYNVAEQITDTLDIGDHHYVKESVTGNISDTATDDVEITVVYTLDDWHDGGKDPEDPTDKPEGGDGIPDKYQVRILYKAKNEKTGSVSPALEIRTPFTDKASAEAGKKIQLSGSTPTPADGYAFAYWFNRGQDISKYRDYSSTYTKGLYWTVKGGETHTFTATFLPDTKGGGPDPENNGDDIPDEWQAKVTFKSVGGDLGPAKAKFDGVESPAKDLFANEAKFSELSVYVTLKDSDGKPSKNGSAVLSASALVKAGEQPDAVAQETAKNTGAVVPAAGNHPDGNHEKAGADWDQNPVGATVTRDTVYTFTYPAKGATITVNYLVEGTDTPVKDANTVGYTAEKGYNVTGLVMGDQGKTVTGLDGHTYVWDSYEIVNPGNKKVDLEKAAGSSMDVVSFTINVYYTLDEIGIDKPDEGDGIPDKYQATVTYTAVNGNVSLEKAVVTLKDSEGNPAKDGTGYLTEKQIADATADTANGYNQATESWDNGGKPTTETAITGDITYTVTFTKNTYTITVNYVDDSDPANTLKDTYTEKVDHSTSYNVDGQIPASIDKDGHHYIKESVTGTTEGIMTGNVEITVVYTLDDIGTEDPNKGDNVPDKYQVVVKYVSDNENRGTVTGDTTKVFTLTDGNGEYVTTGTITPGTENVKTTGKGLYRFNSWNPNPNSKLDVEGGETYTYTAGWRYTGGGGGGTTPTPPTPPTNPTSPTNPTPPRTPTTPTETITDDDVPLAAAPGLNSTDHFAYIIGYEDNTVRPTNNITRAEVATIFFRLMTDEFRSQNWSTTNSFPDVEEGKWYNNAVSTTVQAGLVKGYTDGTFKPTNNITRAEFAAIAARFLSDDAAAAAPFSDTAGHWAEQDIARAVQAGWIKGYPDGTFHPNAYITRAEVMTAVNRMLDRTPDKDHLLPDMIVWSDNPETAWYYEAVQEATNGHDYERDEMGIIEIWTALQSVRDWAALEAQWATANS